MLVVCKHPVETTGLDVPSINPLKVYRGLAMSVRQPVGLGIDMAKLDVILFTALMTRRLPVGGAAGKHNRISLQRCTDSCVVAVWDIGCVTGCVTKFWEDQCIVNLTVEPLSGFIFDHELGEGSDFLSHVKQIYQAVIFYHWMFYNWVGKVLYGQR
nr:hypothetical protein CFP56_02515 [Quercus suber]